VPTCTPCPVGQYVETTGRSSCDTCPDNSVSQSGSSTITACHCSDGYTGTIRTGTSSCAACEPGQFKSGTVPGVACSECSAGFYQDEPHQRSCKSCRGLDGCTCQGKSNNWPAGAGGLCTLGLACADKSTCSTGATCTPTGQNKTQHSCDCVDVDLFGLHCEQTCLQHYDERDPTQPYCENPESVCKYDPEDEKGYVCHCQEGWSGVHCELKVRPNASFCAILY
jgi:hypothetical protein